MKKQFKHMVLIALIMGFPFKALGLENEQMQLSERARIARGLFNDGLYSLAIKELERYREEGIIDEDRCVVNLLLGKSYFILSNYAAIPKLLGDVIDNDCSLLTQEEAYFHSGNAYFKLGDMAAARSYFEKLEYLFPESKYISSSKEQLGEILYLESIELFDAQKYDEALAGFEEVRRLSPASVPRDEILTRMADAYFYKEDYVKSENVYLQLKKADGVEDRVIHIQFQLAAIKFYRGQYEGAIAGMKTFLETFPHTAMSGRAQSIILWSFFRLENYEEALAYLNKVDKENNDLMEEEVKALLISTSTFLASGNALKAMEGLEAALKKFGEDPLQGDIMILLAQVYRKAGYEVVEEETYKEILKRYPASKGARKSEFALGEINFRKGLYNIAAERFQDFLQENFIGLHADDARFFLAESQYLMGDLNEAKNNFTKLIKNFSESNYLLKSHMRVADIQGLSGQYADAAGSYKTIIKRFPKSGFEEMLLWKTGEAFRKSGDLEKAGKAYDRYLDKYAGGQKSMEARMALGDIYYMLGDYGKGVKVFRTLIASSENGNFPAEPALKLARGYLNLNRISDAINTLDLVVKNDPHAEMVAQAYFLKGWAFQQESKYEEANAAYAALLDQYPQSQLKEETLWHLAGNHYALKRYKEALKAFKAFGKAFPDSVRKSEEMVRKCHAAMGDYKSALTASSAFFEMNPQRAIDIQKKYDEAMALFDVQSYGEAIKVAKTIIDKFPSHPLSVKLMVLIGEAYLKEESTKKASEYFGMAQTKLKERSLRNLAYFRLGELAYDEKDFRGSLMLLEKVDISISLSDESYKNVAPFVDPHYMMARTYFLKGDAYLHLHLNEKSLTAFKGLVDVFPEIDGLAREKLKAGLALQQLKDYDLAIKIFTQLIARSGDSRINAEAQYWIGESYQYKGDIERAIVEYLKVTYLYPSEGMWGLTSKYMAAQAYQELGDYELAITLYKKVARDSQDKRKREYAKKRIEDLESRVTKNQRGSAK